jgi:hypothetical protein
VVDAVGEVQSRDPSVHEDLWKHVLEGMR